MAAPQLLPEDFDVDELDEELEEPEEVEEEVEYEEPDDDRSDRFDELKEKGKEKLKEKREQRKQAKEQKKAESEKPPKQEPKPDSPELKQKKLDNTKAQADKVKSGEQKLSKATGEKAAGQGGKAAAKTAGKAAGKEAAAAGKQGASAAAKAASKAAAQAVKVAAKAAAQAVRGALVATSEFWVPALIIILIVVVIIAFIFILFAYSGEGGKGPPIYPESGLQQQKSQFALALSGDQIAKDTVIKDVIESQLTRYDRIKNNTDSYDPSLSAGAATKRSEYETSLNSLLAEQDTEMRAVLLDAILADMAAYDKTLPFGKWITKLAKDRVGKPNLKFCGITDAPAALACASFTSTVLYLAGVPDAIQPSVDEIWKESIYETIVARQSPKSADTYDKYVSSLQPGDIIFWGDGKCSSGGSVLFDHVGFYIGDGRAIDTSSSAGKVLERSAAKRGDCRVFNGAKRYGN